MSAEDVQGRKVSNGFRLTRVGVTGVKKQVTVNRKGMTGCLNCTIDVYVDLPSTQRGSHLSRNLEVIEEAVESSVNEPVNGLEVLCQNICTELFTRHEYATYAEVSIVADYFLTRTGPSGRKTKESFKLMARSYGRLGNGMRKMIGAQAIGMTACPCAMETVRARIGGNVQVEGELPTISHNQRNISTLMVEVPENVDVEANDLIDILEHSFSSPTFEILKRSDEADVVINAHRNPKFVEDVVREILARVLAKYPQLPDEAHVTARSESEESIHKHNAFAERVTTLGELRSATEGAALDAGSGCS
ncbi:MAG TPA: GTP cyclohydrolase MptA [Methanomassiliicoccales archaeon]|nr:GTP cyclohydrolase MptA [Methanomassiliicoccales archaeon]HXZ24148.1 GTP cyclohydrolase MptA [Methanomassiliicoccales archaeon]